MFTTMHWLPNRRAASYTNCGSFTAAELIDTLSQPGQQQLPDVVERADAAAHGERHEHLLGRPPHHVEHDVAPFVAGRDVEEHQLVGPFLFVPRGHLDRIARVAEVDEIGPLHDAPAVDVQTRNHTLGEHRATLGFESAQPARPKGRNRRKHPKLFSLGTARGRSTGGCRTKSRYLLTLPVSDDTL